MKELCTAAEAAGETPNEAELALGIYLHFPWCLAKCPYCDFVSFAIDENDIDHEGYAATVSAEIEQRREILQHRPIRSLFIGGGTPSLWRAEALGSVLEKLDRVTEGGLQGIEITAECNPSSLDAAQAKALVSAGVNRLSVGAQGLDADRLKFLGRLHDGPLALRALDAALRSGARSVNADLIYGVAAGSGQGQTAEQAAREAEQIAQLGIHHVSAYQLTIEPNTQFGEMARAGKLPLLEDAILADSFVAVGDALAAHGFARYEISNYARSGEECEHNLGYWRGRDYLGLGCAAFGALSRSDGTAWRYRNPPTPQRYADMVAGGVLTPHEIEPLDGEARMRERLMLGLRLRGGLDVEATASVLGVEPWPRRRLEASRDLQERGRLCRSGPRLRIPPEAWLWADDIACRLF